MKERFLAGALAVSAVTALGAVGLSADPAGMRAVGPRPLALGAAVWLVVAATSLGLQAATGSL